MRDAQDCADEADGSDEHRAEFAHMASRLQGTGRQVWIKPSFRTDKKKTAVRLVPAAVSRALHAQAFCWMNNPPGLSIWSATAITALEGICRMTSPDCLSVSCSTVVPASLA